MVVGAFFVLCHMGENTSVDGRAVPAINFYGTLKDTSDNTFDVEYITIDHLYKNIPVYEIPKHAEIDPAINTTLLNLSEVQSIQVNNPESIVSFNNRHYIVITVTMNGSLENKHDYLIEKNKQFYCSQLNPAGDIERKLSFQAVATLAIKGHKQSDIEDRNSLTAKKTTLPAKTTVPAAA